MNVKTVLFHIDVWIIYILEQFYNTNLLSWGEKGCHKHSSPVIRSSTDYRVIIH